VIPRELVAQAMRQGEHPLADRHRRQHSVDQMRGALGHPPAAAAGAGRAALTRKSHEALGVAVVALKASEAPGPHAAGEKVAELALDKRRQAVATGAFGGGAEERGEMLADDLVEHGMLRVTRAVGAHRSHRRAGVGRPVRVHRPCAAESAGSGRDRCVAAAPRLPHGPVMGHARRERETTSSGLPTSGSAVLSPKAS